MSLFYENLGFSTIQSSNVVLLLIVVRNLPPHFQYQAGANLKRFDAGMDLVGSERPHLSFSPGWIKGVEPVGGTMSGDITEISRQIFRERRFVASTKCRRCLIEN